MSKPYNIAFAGGISQNSRTGALSGITLPKHVASQGVEQKAATEVPAQVDEAKETPAPAADKAAPKAKAPAAATPKE